MYELSSVEEGSFENQCLTRTMTTRQCTQAQAALKLKRHSSSSGAQAQAAPHAHDGAQGWVPKFLQQHHHGSE